MIEIHSEWHREIESAQNDKNLIELSRRKLGRIEASFACIQGVINRNNQRERDEKDEQIYKKWFVQIQAKSDELKQENEKMKHKAVEFEAKQKSTAARIEASKQYLDEMQIKENESISARNEEKMKNEKTLKAKSEAMKQKNEKREELVEKARIYQSILNEIESLFIDEKS